MRSTSLTLGVLSAILLAGCGPRDGRDTGATGRTDTAPGAMGDTGIHMPDTAMQPGRTGRTGMDTAHTDTGMRRDTGRTGMRTSDTARSNQTKSGVTDTRTGKSTLGRGVTRTRPDQGEPVTSKGDTLRPGGDTVGR